MEREEEDKEYGMTRAACRTMINYINLLRPVKMGFDIEDYITAHGEDFILTFDCDLSYCRIHGRGWILIAAIDLANATTEVYARMILDCLPPNPT